MPAAGDAGAMMTRSLRCRDSSRTFGPIRGSKAATERGAVVDELRAEEAAPADTALLEVSANINPIPNRSRSGVTFGPTGASRLPWTQPSWQGPNCKKWSCQDQRCACQDMAATF